MLQINYNPDVLSSIANLSNDEVFTPPKLVNEILDILPQELFQSKETTFLDPVTKSGVFLREIAKRLNDGLKDQIPDQQKRVNHIFTKQLYGIAITELTSLLARRSVYCSKKANSKYSVCTSFETEAGNIKYDRLQHTWQNGKCTYCGASEEVYSRTDDLETYAYQFIHTDKPQNIFNMKFDVIIGNPPYQMNDGGGRESAAIPLYHYFVRTAKQLSPKFFTMIIPARWYTGGRGLDSFREEMLNDTNISQIHDFPETSDCFPGLNIRGGVCYFLWEKDFKGATEVFNYRNGILENSTRRKLKITNHPYLFRYNNSVSIYKKVLRFKEKTYISIVSKQKPFGLRSNFKDFEKKREEFSNIKLYRFGDNGFIDESKIKKNHHLIKKYKVLVSKASPGGDEYPHKIFSEPIISEPNSICTETYLVIDVLENKEQCENLVRYMKTQFFRFLVSMVKNTQNISKSSFSLVPILDLNKKWNDELLYAKYSISKAESEFIDTMIKPMD